MVISTLCLLTAIHTATIIVSTNSVRRDENCDSFSPDALVTKYDPVRVSERSFPFRIKLSNNLYGDQSTIIVNIEGPDDSSFIVQMRSLNSNHRIGRFQTLLPHSSLQPILCQEFDPSVMATITPINLNSSKLTFHWLGPPTDEGTLALMGIFISGNEYWVIKENGPKLSYQKPKLRKEECITHYSSNELCQEAECEYRLFYELNVDKKIAKVQMRGTGTKKNVYVGMTITSDVNQFVDGAMVVYCISTEKGMKASCMNEIHSVITKKPNVDSDDKIFDCSFKISLEQVDNVVGTPSYFSYFWGSVNPHTGQIILPPAENIKESFQPIIPDGTSRNSCYFEYVPLGYTMNSSTRHSNSSIVFIIIVATFYIFPAIINIIPTSRIGMNYQYNQVRRVSR